jgi:hypothetical protein
LATFLPGAHANQALSLRLADYWLVPKNGSWKAEQPLVLSTVEAFVPGNVEA